ncbi:MAG: hypothetical protein JJ848_000350 [Prochlorococcus marinus CUG1439]|uniref:surface carbohydrate biosynthesis protein n=1 Tax=Prochlorococcus sp. MIT 1314 TaxID=3096220 RepID=UPI001B1176DB|nr:surface carbohydrate biosynthesis protein [Prochlorococcus sp. MIT 1314]MCR8538791.1 hypothetical protein [Prochlorococcus marinus CUG1439]
MRIALIPIESTTREIQSKLLISSELFKNGWIVILGKKKFIFDLTKLLKDCIFLDKGYSKKESEKLFINLKKRNHKIISLDEEGAIDAEGIKNLDNRYTPELFKYCSKVLFWGLKQKNHYAKTKSQKEKSIVTGHPRFHKRNKKDVNLNKSYILVCTNFGWGNNYLGDKWIVKNYQSRIKRIKDLILNDKFKLEIVKKILIELNNKKLKTVLRIHPEENTNYYKKLISANKLDNFIRLDNQNTVTECIEKSRLVIHCDSTAGLDAYLQSKKVYSFNNKKILDQSLICQLPCLVSENYNLNEIIDHKRSFIHLNHDSKINECFKNLNSQMDSIKEIVDAFNTISPKKIIKTKLKLTIVIFCLIVSIKNTLSDLIHIIIYRKKIISDLKFKGFYRYIKSKLNFKKKKWLPPRILCNNFGIWI